VSAPGATAAQPRAGARARGVRIAGAAVLCALAGWLGWVFTDVAPASRDNRGDVWKLPTLPGTDAGDAAKVLAERNIWGAAPAPAQAAAGPAAPLTPPDWRILATAVSGADRVVLIRIGTEPPQELRVGDKLPGGAIIRAVQSDRLVLQLDGKRRILRIPPP
jgi:hypothetical protein